MKAITKTTLALLPGLALVAAAAQAGDTKAGTKSSVYLPGLKTGSLCQYPPARQHPPEFLPNLLSVAETASANDTAATGQALALGTGGGQDRDINVTGSLSANSDVDWYRVTVNKGDILGIAVLKGASSVDAYLKMADGAGTTLVDNDDHGGQKSAYPASSPFPGGVASTDSSMTWFAPSAGTYAIRVSSYNSGSSGAYTLQIRDRRSYPETLAAGTRQIIFVDFNGASGVNSTSLFGAPAGKESVTLSGVSSFLTAWGLTAADESAVITEVMNVIQENYNDLRIASLNGNRATSGVNGEYDVEFRNSRDHADPWGQANVSRMIVGGTIAQLGISTIGIASTIDPGNYSTTDTAVCLLDLLSAASPDPNSVNSISRAAGCTKIQAIGRAVGNACAHEIGHYVGNWHTDNANSVGCIQDQGGNLAKFAGVGADNIMGNADDVDVDIRSDAYIGNEGIGIGQERTDVQSAFGLATGNAGGATPTPTPIPPTATPTATAPPPTATPTATAPPPTATPTPTVPPPTPTATPSGSLAVNTPTSGSVVLTGWSQYTVTVPAGSTFFNVSTKCTTDIDLYIRKAGAPTTATYDMRGYTSSGNEQITCSTTTTPALTSGTWYVGVYGYKAGSFSITAQAGSGNDAFEADGTSATAKWIAVGGVAQTHNINAATDNDYVKFTTTATSNVRITTAGPAGGDTIIYLYNSALTQLNTNDDISTSNYYSQISQASLAAGTYYVKAISYNNASTITGYTITVTTY